jgi:hypothetical protein
VEAAVLVEVDAFAAVNLEHPLRLEFRRLVDRAY